MQNGYNMQVCLLVNNGIDNLYNTTCKWSVIDSFLIKGYFIYVVNIIYSKH